MAETYHLPERLERMQRLSLLVGGAGLAVGILGGFFSGKVFFNGWLFAWYFWLSISLGGLGMVMLHHLTGGDWGLAIRRECEAAALVTPIMFVLFLPMMLGTYYLFPWGNHDWVQSDPILRAQHIYFNGLWFFLRNVCYFACWSVLAAMLASETMQFERTIDYRVVRKMRNLSAGGMVLFFVTVTLASYDWFMSREAHFYSTIIGLMVACGMGLSAMAFVTALLAVLDDESEMLHFLTPPRLNDIGNLILTLVILWAYMSFAQLLIIWIGNIRTETPWYVHRGLGADPNGWRWIGLFLAFCGFLIPFLLLLSRDLKRHLPFLTAIAIGVLFVRAIDVLWLVAPSAPPYVGTGHVVWLAIPLFFGIGGIWFWVFVYMLRRRPLLARTEEEPQQEDHAPIASHEHGGARSAPGVG